MRSHTQGQNGVGKDDRNLPIKPPNKSYPVNFIVISFITILAGAIVVAFVRNRADHRQAPFPSPPKNPEATLTIHQFHHEATENGEKKWTLEAASASLFAARNEARLTDIAVVFSAKKGEALSIRAKEGILNTKTNDLSANGGIRAELPPYTLTTESLNYLHGSRMIQIQEPVEITGRSMTMKAGSLKYDIAKDVLTGEDHVEGTFLEFFE